jgi:hypothetical protein
MAHSYIKAGISASSKDTHIGTRKSNGKKQVSDDVTLVPDGPGRLEIDLFPPASTHLHVHTYCTALGAAAAMI